MSDYDWFEHEKEERAYAEYVERARRLERRAEAEVEQRRARVSPNWDPRRHGWDSAPSRKVRDWWVEELGAFGAYEVARDGERWQALIWLKMAGYRDPVPFKCHFDYLENLVAAIQTGRVDDLLVVDMDLWDPPSHDLGDHAYRGGLPGLGKRR